MYVCVERQMIETERETEREKREGKRSRKKKEGERERENEDPWREEKHLFPVPVAACILRPWPECWPEVMTKTYEDT